MSDVPSAKTCRKCGVVKPLDAFRPTARAKDGRLSLCDGCFRHVRERKPIADRFWSKVDKNGPVHPVLGTACWQWTASLNPTGYGQIAIGGSTCRPTLAHRVAYELAHGPLPEIEGHHGAVVGHLCDNRLCVRVDHLFLGTQADNVADMMAKGRCRGGAGHAAKTHCPQGHAYAGENLLVSSGRRHCRACLSARRRARYAKDLETNRAQAREYQRMRRERATSGQ